MVKDAYQPIADVTNYSSNFYKTEYRFNNRSKYVEEIIEKIDYVRRFLSVEVAPQFEIKYEPFPIIEYLGEINILLNEYSESINGISDFRDNEFALLEK